MCELVVAGSDASILLELCEEGLDAPTLLVCDGVIEALDLAVTSGRDDGFAALGGDEVAQTVGIIGPVGQHLPCRQSTDEVMGRSHVVLLSGAEHEAHRQAEGIDYGVDLGAEPAAGAAESLGLSAPLFTLTPAAWA